LLLHRQLIAVTVNDLLDGIGTVDDGRPGYLDLSLDEKPLVAADQVPLPAKRRH
jgi:hypothetical protein